MAQTSNLTERRVCLFTGASGTLGTAFCQMFRNRYCIAAVYGRRMPSVPSQLQQWINPIGPTECVDPDSVFAIQSDLLADREIGRIVELTLARFGRIDLLVNGAVHARWASAVETNELIQSASKQFEMNVIVPLKLSVEVARQFWRDRERENRGANRNVVNVSSTAGVYVYPNSQQSVYSASKAALNYLTCHLAEEFRAFGVRVNAIAPNAFPGIVKTRHVASSIHGLDQHTISGQIVIIDSGGEAHYCPKP